MASIQFKELSKKTNLNENKYTYIDLHLDISQTERGVSVTNQYKSIKGKDIAVDYDEEAIRNSIFNILNTRPLQRIILPNFGCNLLGYVGRQVTLRTAEDIGRTIYDAIKIWEPRVTIDDVLVIAKPDENEYDVTITITIPTLKKRDVKIIGTLTNSGILESNMI